MPKIRKTGTTSKRMGKFPNGVMGQRARERFVLNEQLSPSAPLETQINALLKINKTPAAKRKALEQLMTGYEKASVQATAKQKETHALWEKGQARRDEVITWGNIETTHRDAVSKIKKALESTK